MMAQGDVRGHENEDRHAPAHPADGLLTPLDADEQPLLSVVMPTLNEENSVGECLDQAKHAIHELGVSAELVVSDSSTDRTPEIARERGAIVYEPDRPGYGYAYRYAFERARGEYVVMGDADSTYDFERIPALLELVTEGGADIAIGSRLDGEIRDGAMPALHRYVGNPALTWFLNLFYDADVSDAHSGFRVLRRSALEEMDLSADGMELASEMIMEASVRGLEIAELPITYHPREGEATLHSFRDGWRHVRFMLLNAPGYLFSGPGLVIGLLGLALMTVAYADVSLFGATPGVHSMVAGSLLTILGYQVGSFGVFATIAGDPVRNPEDEVTRWFRERFRLEHGGTVGVVLFVLGVSYATLLFWSWVQSGYVQLPSLLDDIVAMTAIVLGAQTVFGSFFLSAIGDDV